MTRSRSPLTVTPVTERARWHELLIPQEGAHILQSWDWGEFKRVTTGWQPTRLAFYHRDRLIALASIGARRIGPLTALYAPKGPVFADPDPDRRLEVIAALEAYARRRAALWLKIDPDIVVGTGVPGADDDRPDAAGLAFAAALRARGWRFSADQVQFRNTITLDLTRSEADILAGMGQSTRRKIRQAEKAGVTIRPGTLDDLPLLYALYRVTGARDGFLIRPFAYYERAWRDFMAAGLAQPLIAEVEGRAIAHVILFRFGRTCWYFYGASADTDRDKMPNYLLQWEAIRWARAQGCAVYDFWGAPDAFVETDALWGVYTFKRGFHGVVTRHLGAWDYAPSSALYAAYTGLMPRLRAWLRARRAS